MLLLLWDLEGQGSSLYHAWLNFLEAVENRLTNGIKNFFLWKSRYTDPETASSFGIPVESLASLSLSCRLYFRSQVKGETEARRLLLPPQASGEIVAGRFPVSQGAGSGDGCPDGSGKVLFRIRVRGPSWTRRQNAPHRETRRFCRFWGAREGGPAADSLPSRAPHCRHILRAQRQGPRFESNPLTAMRSWPTYFSYLCFYVLFCILKAKIPYCRPYSVVLWFLDKVCCKMCTRQLSRRSEHRERDVHSRPRLVFLLPLGGCVTKGIWDTFMFP